MTTIRQPAAAAAGRRAAGGPHGLPWWSLWLRSGRRGQREYRSMPCVYLPLFMSNWMGPCSPVAGGGKVSREPRGANCCLPLLCCMHAVRAWLARCRAAITEPRRTVAGALASKQLVHIPATLASPTAAHSNPHRPPLGANVFMSRCQPPAARRTCRSLWRPSCPASSCRRWATHSPPPASSWPRWRPRAAASPPHSSPHQPGPCPHPSSSSSPGSSSSCCTTRSSTRCRGPSSSGTTCLCTRQGGGAEHLCGEHLFQGARVRWALAADAVRSRGAKHACWGRLSWVARDRAPV